MGSVGATRRLLTNAQYAEKRRKRADLNARLWQGHWPNASGGADVADLLIILRKSSTAHLIAIQTGPEISLPRAHEKSRRGPRGLPAGQLSDRATPRRGTE
jgi:hypothetical protein